MRVDLRSDTVTRPTKGMLQAMMSAEVGDDVYGEDPTVNELEAYVADLFGKEAAVFVASGTMANQVALAIHAGPGDEVILEATAHPFRYEGGAPAAVSGISVMPVPGDRGILSAEAVEANIRPASFGVHVPRTRLIGVENTANAGGGTVYPRTALDQLRDVSERRGIPMHLDGARIWNAHIASGESFAELSRGFSTVSCCLSKGLGCPVGSLVLGSAAAIEEGRRVRKRLGGAMRQVGHLAGAGLYALKHHVARIAEDHERAKRLANEMGNIRGILPEEGTAQTNMVFFNVPDGAPSVVESLAADGIGAIAFDRTRIRFVTHLDISDQDIEDTLAALSRASQSAGW